MTPGASGPTQLGELDLYDYRATFHEMAPGKFMLGLCDRGSGLGVCIVITGPELGELIDFIEESVGDFETLHPPADGDDTEPQEA